MRTPGNMPGGRGRICADVSFADDALESIPASLRIQAISERESEVLTCGEALPLGRCYMRDMDIAEWVVRSGYAMADRDQSDAYVVAEDHAREAETGIWAGPFVTPAEWRDGKR